MRELNVVDQNFLASIQAAPDDDTLKLVYADWLDEQGDPRGQIIRLSVELPKWAKTRHWKMAGKKTRHQKRT